MQTSFIKEIFENNAVKQMFNDPRNGSSYSYGEIWSASLRFSAFLKSCGLQAGETVILSAENCAEIVVMSFGCMHAGVRIVPINPAFMAHDYEYIISNSGANVIFTTPTIMEKISAVVENRNVRAYCFLPGVERAKEQNKQHINFQFWNEIDKRAASNETLAESSDDTVFMTMFSSGTTSAPKGINISYGGIIANGRAFCSTLGLDADSRFYNVLPMTYLGGFYNLMLIPVICGGSFVLDGVFGVPNIYAFWETVQEFDVNTLWFSPTMLSMLLSIESDIDMSFLPRQIKLSLVGMAPLPLDLKIRFEKQFDLKLYENYGLSETTFITTCSPGMPGKEKSVGVPIEGVSVSVGNTNREPLPNNTEGEICVCTPYFMKGYELAGEGDRENVLDADCGKFLTGDLGYIDDDGELFITGRKKDLIIRGGINISPKLIEDTVYRLEGVDEAAVIGMPHPVYGEEVVLVVQVRGKAEDALTIEKLQKFCSDNIAHFQRPKQIFIIDDMPKGATGKVQKNIIRRLIAEKFDPLNG